MEILEFNPINSESRPVGIDQSKPILVFTSWPFAEEKIPLKTKWAVFAGSAREGGEQLPAETFEDVVLVQGYGLCTLTNGEGATLTRWALRVLSRSVDDGIWTESS